MPALKEIFCSRLKEVAVSTTSGQTKFLRSGLYELKTADAQDASCLPKSEPRDHGDAFGSGNDCSSDPQVNLCVEQPGGGLDLLVRVV